MTFLPIYEESYHQIPYLTFEGAMPLDLANVDWMVSSANKCLQVLRIRHRGLFSLNSGF